MRRSPDDALVLEDDPNIFPQAGLPLAIRLLAERVQWEAVVDALLPWDPVRTQTPPSRLLLALVMNVVTHRTPLYHVERWAATLPLDLLWTPGVQAATFNDDALGRVLEKLAVHGRTVVGTLGVRWQALGHAAPTLLHTDTTSFSLFGDYPGSAPDGDAPHITYGYSKAHRPDLKQIVVGLTTDAVGQILLGDVLAGNTSDKAWMPPWLATLDREVPADAWKQALYVTDSAGITPGQLDACAALDVRWLGRLPETYTLARTVKATAWAAPDAAWEDLGTFSPRKGAARYRAQIHPGTLATYAVRCVVVHSDALDRRRERTLQREIAREAEALRAVAAALARQGFACVADAEAAHAVALKAAAPRWHAVTPAVAAETVIHRGRGRPRRDTPPPTRRQYRLRWSWAAPDPTAVQAERQRRSTFVLVTDDPARSARELVAAYKGQTHAEQAFRWAKQPWHCDAFYLHNPDRVAGLGFLLLLALQFVRAMRQLAREAFQDQPPWALPDGRKITAPADELILQELRPLWLRRRGTPVHPWYQWGHVAPHLQRLLEALQLPLYVRFEPG